MAEEHYARWVPVVSDGDHLIGEREGHAAAVLSTETANSSWWMVVLGGFVEGSTSPIIVGADVTPYPIQASLTWKPLLELPRLAEREGHTMIRHPQVPTTAVVLMGLSSDVELLNDVWTVELSGADSTSPLPRLLCHEVTCIGDAPSPRARHAAAAAGDSCWIFGGETEGGHLCNDLYELSLSTWCWRKYTGAGSDAPMYRGLPFFGVVSAPEEEHLKLLVTGGLWYPENGCQASMDDAWLGSLDTASSRVTWTTTDAVLSAPANGGVTVPVGCGLLLACGKDTSTGCDECVRLGGGRRCRLLPPPEFDHVEHEDGVSRGYPHWRYLPAAVSWPTVDGTMVIIIAGQCRHPDPVACYAMHLPE